MCPDTQKCPQTNPQSYYLHFQWSTNCGLCGRRIWTHSLAWLHYPQKFLRISYYDQKTRSQLATLSQTEPHLLNIDAVCLFFWLSLYLHTPSSFLFSFARDHVLILLLIKKWLLYSISPLNDHSFCNAMSASNLIYFVKQLYSRN